MNDRLYLVAHIGDTRFAIDARHVDSVASGGEIVPVALSAPYIAGLCALRSRIITLIDTMAAIEGGRANAMEEQTIVVVKIDGHLFGLQVDDADDVVPCSDAQQPVCASFEAGWKRVSTGIIEISGQAIVVIDPAALLATDESLAA